MDDLSLSEKGVTNGSRVIFEFIKAHQATYPVTTLCRLLDVSTSGYYAWYHRPVSDRTRANIKLTEQIREIHQRSDSTYGAPRIAEAKLAIFEYIEGWYNPHRRHSAIRYKSPINYEKLTLQTA